MSITENKSLRLNAITGPTIDSPAMSPDTLRELEDPYFGFLQTYTLSGNGVEWHGRLRNIGMQYLVPLSILLPPNITEMLKLRNRDMLSLSPCLLSEARELQYVRKEVDDTTLSRLPKLCKGMELGKELTVVLKGHAIELQAWAPEGSYYGESTQLIEASSDEHIHFTPESLASEVILETNSLNFDTEIKP